MKWITRILAIAALFALVLATPAAKPARAYAVDGFEITSYDVRAVVSEDNVYDITETIAVHFTEYKHGIYRTIPLNTVMVREEGNSRVRSWVTDAAVEGYDYSVKKEAGNYYIYVGSEDEYVTGDQTYRISYKLHFGDDGMRDFDEAYFNIIGTEWSTMIDSATFSVTLPESFDAKDLGFSVGYYGAQGYDPAELEYSVDGNTITGRVLRELYPNEGINMRLELPQGYFDMSHDFSPDWILVIVLGLFVLIGTVLFFLYGIDKKPVVTVEVFPPEYMTPTELGYINDGYVDTRDVISLIIYWADQGCLSITPEGAGYRFTCLRPLRENARSYEQHMFSQLFKFGPEITTGQLEDMFYKTISQTSGMVYQAFEPEQSKIFTRKSMKVQPLISFLSVLPVILTLLVTLSRSDMGLLFAVMVSVFLGVFLLLPMFWFIGLLRHWRNKTRTRRVVSLIVSMCIWVGTIAIFIPTALDWAYVSALPWIAAGFSVILALEAAFIRKRTPRGVELLGKTMGFVRFIEYAEKDRIEKLVEQYPHYFYHILPYAYALGITDKWAKNFEGIATPPPEWYHSDWHTTGFSPMAFSHSFDGAMRSISSHMTSSPSSSGSGGGGSSGGGSSGGGGGGGGGGSW